MASSPGGWAAPAAPERRVFRVASARDECADPVSRPPSRHALTGAFDDPRNLEPGEIRGAGRRRVPAKPLHDVGPVDAGRLHPHEQVARAGLAASVALPASGPRGCRVWRSMIARIPLLYRRPSAGRVRPCGGVGRQSCRQDRRQLRRPAATRGHGSGGRLTMPRRVGDGRVPRRTVRERGTSSLVEPGRQFPQRRAHCRAAKGIAMAGSKQVGLKGCQVPHCVGCRGPV